jgi:hypothetical protein
MNHIVKSITTLAVASLLHIGGSTWASQPLPQGKARFSVCFGNFDTVDATTWVRMGRWNFDGTNGTISAYFWQWDSTTGPFGQKGKTALNAHTCTFDGQTSTCSVYTPTGWIAPAGQYFQWSGTYTYNTTTGLLSITWTVGASETESWLVTLPESGTAKLDFSGSSYGITHGRGYGSNAAWSTFINVTTVPRTTYKGSWVLANTANGSVPPTVTPSTPGAWNSSSVALDLTSFTSASSGIALHAWTASSPGVCQSGCATSRTGIVYHLGGTNTDRAMAWSHWCACLSVTWPCYSGQLHPYAMDQIISDNGTFRGMIGIEAQDEPGSPGYQYQLKDFNLLP